MSRLWIYLAVVCVLLFSNSVFARQSGGGGGDDLEGVCELAGGTWTGSESGNWACCWQDWGCYGCHSGVCKMQCRTKRCRDANRVRKAGRGTTSVKGLVAPGAKAPIVPIKPRNR